jgi:hypothetical protein
MLQRKSLQNQVHDSMQLLSKWETSHACHAVTALIRLNTNRQAPIWVFINHLQRPFRISLDVSLRDGAVNLSEASIWIFFYSSHLRAGPYEKESEPQRSWTCHHQQKGKG